MTLTECEDVWRITYQSQGDGRRLEMDLLFSSKGKADDYIRKHLSLYNACSSQAPDIWKDCFSRGETRYFRFVCNRPKQVIVDLDEIKSEALNKLTAREREALGL